MDTATVRRLDGKPMVRDADGLIQGEPLNLTAGERAKLPPLRPMCESDENEYATGIAAGGV